MSGICGIVSAQPVRHWGVDAVERGLDAMAHRSRDGMSCYHDEHVLIGHGLFDTGCNGFAVDDDGFVIAFDGRIDNADALRTRLREAVGLAASPPDTLSDTRLLLAAYRAFGADLASLLLGDFAIAIWDPLARRTWLARDHFGVKPLFYRPLGQEMLFASEIKALLAMRPEAAVERREEAMAEFVNGDFSETDRESTFFTGIYRLLPGHYAWASGDGFQAHCFWQLDPALPGERGDVGGEFRALFREAIRRRLRGNAPTGALLSGGLDSSSIVSSLAAGRGDGEPAIQAFSLIFSDPEITDERDYIAAVVDMHTVAHHRVDGSPVSGLAHADEVLAEQDQPPAGPNGGIFRYFLQQVAARFDGRIILHGHGGDEVVSDGGGLFGELAASGQWNRLWAELQAVSHVTGAPGPHFRRLIWRRGIRRSVGKLLNWPMRLLARNDNPARDPVTTSPDGQERPIEQAAHLRKLTSPIFAQALEVIDIEAACAGVELRMPFLDVDLVTFCVSVEASEKWQNGLPRSLLRNAMHGLLPEKVRLRTDKHDFATHLRRSLLRCDSAAIDEAIERNPAVIAPYCDTALLQTEWAELKTTGELDNRALMRLWRAVMLHRWLTTGGSPGGLSYEAAA